jgi:hypothetical protein
MDKFYEYGKDSLPEDFVACNYIEQIMEPDLIALKDPRDIPTPRFDSILHFQNMDKEVRTWMYCILGRLLRDGRSQDDWELTLVIKDSRGTGATYIADTMAEIYPPWAVAELNDGDPHDRVNPEQHLLVVEKVQSYRHHSVDVPRLIVTKKFELAPSEHELIVFDFSHPTPFAWKRVLKIETANLLLKMNRFYKMMATTVGERNVWEILPDYFLQIHNRVVFGNHPLYIFLADNDSLIVEQERCMPFSMFKKLLSTWMRDNGYPKVPITREFYFSMFERFGITITKESRPEDSYEPHYGYWLHGITVREPDDPSAYPFKKRKTMFDVYE